MQDNTFERVIYSKGETYIYDSKKKHRRFTIAGFFTLFCIIPLGFFINYAGLVESNIPLSLALVIALGALMFYLITKSRTVIKGDITVRITPEQVVISLNNLSDNDKMGIAEFHIRVEKRKLHQISIDLESRRAIILRGTIDTMAIYEDGTKKEDKVQEEHIYMIKKDSADVLRCIKEVMAVEGV